MLQLGCSWSLRQPLCWLQNTSTTAYRKRPLHELQVSSTKRNAMFYQLRFLQRLHLRTTFCWIWCARRKDHRIPQIAHFERALVTFRVFTISHGTGSSRYVCIFLKYGHSMNPMNWSVLRCLRLHAAGVLRNVEQLRRKKRAGCTASFFSMYLLFTKKR